MEDLLCLIKCIHNSFQSNPCLSGCYTLSALLTTNLSVPSLKSLYHYSEMMFKRKSVLIIPCLELFSASHYTFGSYFKAPYMAYDDITSHNSPFNLILYHLAGICFSHKEVKHVVTSEFLLCSPWQSGWSAVSLSLLTWFLIFIQVCDTLSSLQSLLYPFYFVPSTLFPPSVLRCHFVFIFPSWYPPLLETLKLCILVICILIRMWAPSEEFCFALFFMCNSMS